MAYLYVYIIGTSMTMIKKAKENETRHMIYRGPIFKIKRR